MKSYYKKLTGLCIAFILIGYSGAAMAQKVFRTTISGIIGENKVKFGQSRIDLFDFSKDSSIVVKLIDSRFLSFNDNKSNELEVNVKNGKFTIDISINAPVYLSFCENGWTNLRPLPFQAYGIYEMLIEPGDQLSIDYRKGDQLYSNNLISGKGSEKFLCLREIVNKFCMRKSPREFFEDRSIQRFKTEDEFLQIAYNTLNTYKKRLSSIAFNVLKGDLTNAIVNAACEGFVAHGNKDAELRTEYYKRMLAQKPVINLSDSAANTSRDYLGFVQNKLLIAYMLKNKLDFPREVKTVERYKLYMDSLPAPLNDRAIAPLLITKMMLGETTELKDLIERYLIEGDQKDKNLQAVKNYYEQKIKIVKGSAAYPFALKDTAGRIVRMEDFKGKVVMIDFMFTACPGCVSLTPVLTEFEESYKGKDVVFLSISVEKDLKDVKKGIGKSSVASSLQLYTNGEGSKHPIIDHYMIGAYPQLLVIDREGKLVTTNAPDPRGDNGKALAALLEETLNKASK